MSNVKRWAHTVTWEGLQISATYMAINDGGEYVMHADYAALEAECEKLRNSLAGSNNQARANKLEAEKIAIDWLKVLEERDALAAERAALRQQRDKLAGLLRKVLATHKRWPDLAPSLSLCADIKAALSELTP